MANPTPKQIAEAFKEFLYEGSDGDLPTGHGKFVLTNYDKFAEMHLRERVHESLYEQVYTAALELGVVLGFGEHGIIVGTDGNFGVALRWEYAPS